MATLETTVQSLHKFATPLDGTQFDMGVTLGTVCFARVRFATHKATNTVWAIKILKKAEIIRLQQLEHMLSDKFILLCMNHPFIVNLSGTYQDTKYLYMVLEYVIGGEFFTHLRKARRFKVLLNKGHGKGVDWWTLGILLYEMLAGQPPFCYDDPMRIYQQILSGKLNFPRFFDRNAMGLIKRMLTCASTILRNGTDDIKKHKFFADVVWEDLLGRKRIAPIIPRVGNANDTSNFDPYPDSMEDAIVPVYDGEDPFAEF
ncbi:hypothetical protein PsorP6_009397 [Peronosclerospora sorghi]|uniref:Uncharacterized protein n=1 Tax=Peronosclerospora sorghi TaxID=230839 RepID=A0ACC0VYR1_9STRA|nr:hypothetical protein PsorP6_009397 [Peronosclerospora sorghi]